MWCRVVWYQGDMGPAEYDRDSAVPISPRQLVGTLGGTRDNRDADEIGVKIVRYVLNAFVEQRQFMFNVVGYE